MNFVSLLALAVGSSVIAATFAQTTWTVARHWMTPPK